MGILPLYKKEAIKWNINSYTRSNRVRRSGLRSLPRRCIWGPLWGTSWWRRRRTCRPRPCRLEWDVRESLFAVSHHQIEGKESSEIFTTGKEVYGRLSRENPSVFAKIAAEESVWGWLSWFLIISFTRISSGRIAFKKSVKWCLVLTAENWPSYTRWM